MGKPLKQHRKVDEESESDSDPELDNRDVVENDMSPDEHDDDDDDDDDDNDDNSLEGSDEMEDEYDEEQEMNEEQKDTELAQLAKEISVLQHEQDLLKNLKRHKDEDLEKGQAVKNQKALWDKALEFRFLLQKAFSSSNRLPQEPIRSLFCSSDNGVTDAYSDLITSSTKTLDSLLQLEEALLEKNPTISQSAEVNPEKQSEHLEVSGNSDREGDEEWLKISQMHSRISSFRDKSIDKWHRKTQVTTGAAAIRGKLHAFNQNISEQVAAYMRDPSKMIKGMRLNRSAIALFGNVLESTGNLRTESMNADGDPELLDDSDFYRHLLKEFFETIDPTSSETAFYALKRLQTKKRKIVDRRASKSRKIRYNVHEKIVNFMAPQPMDRPPMAPQLFENLFKSKS